MQQRLSISKEEINELPRYIFEGAVEVIEHEDKALRAIESLKNEKLLGFDTETRAAFRKGERYDVSLLQLASANTVYLFRLNKLPKMEPLFQLLADPSIVKAGVGIENDIKELQKLCAFTPHSFVDLALVAKKRKITNFGLRALTAIVLGKRLSKKAKVSNWDRQTLTPEQITYAACDGAVGYAIYREFFKTEKGA